MKTIGLLGGMSWESTVTYYQLINEAVKNALGGYHSAKILMYSVDFAELEAHMSAGEWKKCADILSDAARGLEQAGADVMLICTNTLHKVVEQVRSSIKIPVLHIADAAAAELLRSGVRKAALLGTKYTMTQDFFKDRLADKGIEVIVPTDEDMNTVNDVIFNELCLGVVSDSSRAKYAQIIDKLKAMGAEGVVLGCTEIGMLISQADSSLPVFDTTCIHAAEAARYALSE